MATPTTRSPALAAAMAAGGVAAGALLDVLADPTASPELLQKAADRARRAMNELWTLAGCDLRRRAG